MVDASRPRTTIGQLACGVGAGRRGRGGALEVAGIAGPKRLGKLAPSD
jgi:hypothetical protein